MSFTMLLIIKLIILLFAPEIDCIVFFNLFRLAYLLILHVVFSYHILNKSGIKIMPLLFKSIIIFQSKFAFSYLFRFLFQHAPDYKTAPPRKPGKNYNVRNNHEYNPIRQ